MLASILLWISSSPRLLNDLILGSDGGHVHPPVGSCALAGTTPHGAARISIASARTRGGMECFRRLIVATPCRVCSHFVVVCASTSNAQSSAVRCTRHRRQALAPLSSESEPHPRAGNLG